MWSENQLRDHVREPLILIDAKTLLFDVGTQSTPCEKVGMTSEEPMTGHSRDGGPRIAKHEGHRSEDSWGHSASSLAIRSSVTE